jgi:hypothetical protein
MTMKGNSIVFLQAVIMLMGVIALVVLIRFPLLEGRAQGLDLLSVYLDPFILYGYAASVAFFVALYKAFKVLGNIRHNRLFSIQSVRILRRICRSRYRPFVNDSRKIDQICSKANALTYRFAERMTKIKILSLALFCLMGSDVSGQADPFRYAKGQKLSSEENPRVLLRFNKNFKYIGKQTFILFENSKVTQLYYAYASGNQVKAFYTVQFEEYLPEIDETYNYSIEDSLEMNGAFFLYGPVFNEPNKTLNESRKSDVWHKYKYLQSKGFTLPDEVGGHRFVKVLGPARKKEMLIVYNEDIKLSNTTFAEINEGTEKFETLKANLLKRALAGFSVLKYKE